MGLEKILEEFKKQNFKDIILYLEKNLDENDPLFHEKNIILIKSYLKTNQYDLAREILEFELNQPFIKEIYEIQYEDLYERLTAYERFLEGPKEITFSKIKEFLKADSLEKKIIGVYHIRELNVRKYTNFLQELLLDDNYPNQIKTMIIEIFIEQRFEDELLVRKFNKTKKIIPTKLNNNFFKELANLEKELDQDQSIDLFEGKKIKQKFIEKHLENFPFSKDEIRKN